MKLEYVGFAELSIPGPLSLVDAPRERRSAEELRQILGYLGDGHLLAASGAVADVLDRSRQRVVAAEVRTDGVWVWPNEITYYVANYGVAVPERFVAHARTSGWSVPPLQRDRLMEILRTVQHDLHQVGT